MPASLEISQSFSGDSTDFDYKETVIVVIH